MLTCCQAKDTLQQRQGPSSGVRRPGPSKDLSTLLAQFSLRFYRSQKQLSGVDDDDAAIDWPAALSRISGDVQTEPNDRYGLALIKSLARFWSSNFPALRRGQSRAAWLDSEVLVLSSSLYRHHLCACF